MQGNLELNLHSKSKSATTAYKKTVDLVVV